MSNSSSICQDEANIESNRPFLKQKLEIAAGAYNWQKSDNSRTETRKSTDS
jgi:hypothetical protein